MRSLRALVPVLATVAIVLVAGEALACPNCKTTVAEASVPKSGDPASAFGYSIYVMMGSVLGIAGWIVFTIARAVRRADSASA